MEMTELRNRLRAALTDFLWDQWVALGLAGHASGPPVPFVIDPEALLLATLRFGMNEARFRGEVLDWLQRNGSLLSVQRMKNLDVATRMAPPEHIRGLSAFMVRAGHPNWKTLDTRVQPAALTDFTGSSLRGMSQPPDPSKPEAFLLRMRLLFGVNARAEVITWMFTHATGHAAMIARETGWFSKSVQAILNDLEQAGMLVSRTEGKRKECALSPRANLWNPGLASGLHWFTQGMFYSGILHVLNTLDAAADPGLSPQARAIAIRRDLTPLESAFRQAGLATLYGDIHRERGEALVQGFENGTASLIRLLETKAGIGDG
jgi:hypothetical protein